MIFNNLNETGCNMIKILFFIDSISGGGAEKVLRNLVNNMDQNKFEITIQTINDSAKSDTMLKDGIRYKTINKFRNCIANKLYQYWIRLCAELKIIYPLYIKDDYDIEVAYLECGPTKIIASSTNKKAVKIAWVHCDLEKKEGFVDSISKSQKYYECFDKIVCVSKNVKDSFEKLFGKDPESIVLYNVNDEKEIKKNAELSITPLRTNSGQLLVAVGRLTRQKGFDRLIECCKRLRDAGYNFELWILGEGEDRQKLEELVQEYELKNMVNLTGFVLNPYPYIKEADILVCSSRYEGMSTVVTEGLILGKAIVTTACTGMEELLGNSEYGIITENNEKGLYYGLRKMLDAPEIIIELSKKAEQRGKMLKKKTTVEATENFFLSLFCTNQKMGIRND